MCFMQKLDCHDHDYKKVLFLSIQDTLQKLCVKCYKMFDNNDGSLSSRSDMNGVVENFQRVFSLS